MSLYGLRSLEFGNRIPEALLEGASYRTRTPIVNGLPIHIHNRKHFNGCSNEKNLIGLAKSIKSDGVNLDALPLILS